MWYIFYMNPFGAPKVQRYFAAGSFPSLRSALDRAVYMNSYSAARYFPVHESELPYFGPVNQ